MARSETQPGTDEIRRSIEERVRDVAALTTTARPKVLLGVLAGAALWPIVAPLVGTGAAVGVLGGVMSLLGGPGKTFISDFLERSVRRGRGAPELSREVRDDFERQLLQQLTGQDERSAALRGDVARLLRDVGAVEVALSATSSSVRPTLVQSLTELGEKWIEFEWMLEDMRVILVDVHARQAEALGVQRMQLDLQREQLVKTNLLIRLHDRRGKRTPGGVARPPDDATLDGAPSPYKGLEAFQAEDAELFFGREEVVAELLARLAETNLLVVVGPSGSGKSSLVNAGLVPAIWERTVDQSEEWRTVVLTPGYQPVDEIAMRVAGLAGVAPDSLVKQMRVDPRALELGIRQALRDEPPQARVLLVVDQVEEVFTLCHDEGERSVFIEALFHATQAATSQLVAILTLRADFYGRMAAYEGVASALQDNNVLLAAPRADELGRMIERPAEMAGLLLEDGLAELLIEDLGDEPGTLPLLSHALRETWVRRRGRELTIAGYVDAGSVRGAIAQTADSVFEVDLSPAEQRIARGIFVRLARLGETTDDTRRRLRFEDLAAEETPRADLEQVVHVLGGARLLTVGAATVDTSPAGLDMLGDATVEVSHEALIKHWPRLRAWLAEDAESHRIHARLTQAADEWRTLARDQGVLYRGAPLLLLRDWADQHGGELNDLEREFVAASESAEVTALESERRRSRRLKAVSLALLLLLILAAVTAGFAVQQTRRVEEQRRLAISRALAQQAMGRLDTNVDLANLLGLEAYDRAPTIEARSSLIEAVLRSAQLEGVLRDPRLGGPSEIQISPDGRLVAATSVKRIFIWDVEGRRLRWSATEQGSAVNAIRFSANGSLLVLGKEDGSVSLWDLDDRRRTVLPSTRDPGVVDVAVGEGGGVVSASVNGAVQLWDPSRRRWSASSESESRHFGDVSFSGDATRVGKADPEEGDVSVSSVHTGDRLWEGRVSAPTDIALDQDGTVVAVADGRAVKIWSLAPNVELPTIRVATGLVSSIALSRDGMLVATGTDDGKVSVWKVGQQEAFAGPLSGHVGAVESVAFSPEGDRLASEGVDGTIRLWDASGRSSASSFLSSSPRPVTDLAFLGVDELAAVAGDGKLTLWDVSRSRSFGEAEGQEEAAIEVDYSRELGLLAVGRAGGAIDLWDVRGDGSRRSVGRHGGRVTAISIASTGDLLASVGGGKEIRLWDVRRKEPLQRLPVGSAVLALALAPDGTTLAAGTSSGAVLVWRCEPDSCEQPPRSLSGDRRAEIAAVALSADGRMLAAGGFDRKVWLWDLRRDEGVGLVGHESDVLDVSFSPDGRILASAGADGTVRLWDVAAQRGFGRLPTRAGSVRVVAFSPDGRTLASGGDDGRAVIWNRLLLSSDVAAWREHVCSVIARSLTRSEWRELVPGEDYHETCPEA